MNLKTSLQLLFLTSMQKDIQLQAWNKFPSHWIKYGMDLDYYEQTQGEINYREILQNELVIDVDAEYIECAPLHANLIQMDLDKKRMYYSRWLSGGDGIHFHLLFDPEDMVPVVVKFGYTQVKEKLLNYIISPNNINPVRLDSHVCFGHNRLICLEYTKHKKGKVKTLIKDVDSRKYNRFPMYIVTELEKEHEAYEKGTEKLKEIRKVNRGYKLPCELFMEGNTINGLNVFKLNDGLYRLMFIYVNSLTNKGLNKDEAFEQAVIFRESFKKKHLQASKKKVNDKIIKYMISKTNGSLGCRFTKSAFKEIGASKVCESCIHVRG